MIESILEKQRELAAGYVLNNLAPEEAEVLESLLDENPDMAHLIEQMQQEIELAYAPVEVPLPSHLKASILEASEGASPQPPVPDSKVTSILEAPRSGTRQRATRRWRMNLGAIAALLIAGLSVSNYATWQSLQQATSEQSEFTTVALSPTENGVDGGAVTIELSPETAEARLTEQLPPLPEGQVYAVWTVLQPDAPYTTDQQNAILTHTFTGEENQTQSIVLPPVYRDGDWVRAIAITIEDADAPQRHASPPIFLEAV
ncbi:MAG: anti-sigma factor domain-containing protein [Elainellaceae cyanobacterium]